VPIFKGRGPKGGMFIQNERVGYLYLRFHFLKHRPPDKAQSGGLI